MMHLPHQKVQRYPLTILSGLLSAGMGALVTLLQDRSARSRSASHLISFAALLIGFSLTKPNLWVYQWQRCGESED